MHKSRLGALIIDCQTEQDLERYAAFWSEALGYSAEPPQADEKGKYVKLFGPDGEVQISLQMVDHESRVHLDIESDDIEAEVKRLEGLGAKRLAAIKRWTVMEAPSGHRFCVIGPYRSDFAENAPIRSS